MNAVTSQSIRPPSQAVLQSIFRRASQSDLQPFLDGGERLARAGILASRERLAMFLAQCAHESEGLLHKVENLNYSAARLVQVWPSRFPNEAAARPYCGNPMALANKVYSGRMGNTLPGDGWLYRGRGYFQLTGKEAYQAVAGFTGLDLVRNPDLAATAEGAFVTAVGFWQWKRLGERCADAKPVASVTLALNGGRTGLAEREGLYKLALELLHG